MGAAKNAQASAAKFLSDPISRPTCDAPALIEGPYFASKEFSDDWREAGVERALPGLALLPMKAGDRVRIEQSGGGGWGDARLRDPEAVLRDVDDGIVSLESARRDYGVVAERNANGELVVAALERG